MKNKIRALVVLLCLCLLGAVPALAAASESQGRAPTDDVGPAGVQRSKALREAAVLLSGREDGAYRERSRLRAFADGGTLAQGRSLAAQTETSRAQSVPFSDEQNVFVDSVIALHDLEDPDEANVTLPVFRGIGPDGEADEYFIVTEAADFDVARLLGVNYAPKLVFARGSGGDQQVTLQDGRIKFRGTVDFGPQRILEAGDGPFAFPPSVAEPGAVADDEWSSVVVTPSGSVLNVQLVANETGEHDRLLSIDREAGEVTLQLLDGFQGGDRFYYHLVTDSSDPVAATIELGVYAPRLANLQTSVGSNVFDDTALLGFSPNVNGETGADNPQRQGLNSTIVDDDRDPINVFPLDPDNDQRFFNNYSPLWDAHLNAWTDEAIEQGLRRQITGFADLRDLVDRGLVTSFAGSTGPENRSWPVCAAARSSSTAR